MTRLLKTFESCSRHLLIWKEKKTHHVYTTLVTYTCLTVASSIVRAWMRRSSFVLLLNNIPIFCRAPFNCTDQNTSKKSGNTMMQRKTFNTQPSINFLKTLQIKKMFIAYNLVNDR
jgi:hypothetical protein